MFGVSRAARLGLGMAAAAALLSGCGFRLGSKTVDPNGAAAQVKAAQLRVEDDAWALRSIFFRPDFGPEWREIRSAGGQPTMGLPFLDCLQAANGAPIEKTTISANEGSPRFTRDNGAFAASNALVLSTTAEADKLYKLAVTPQFTACVAKNTVDFKAQTPTGDQTTSPLTAPNHGDASTATRVNLNYTVNGTDVPFVADFMVVKLNRALLALWFTNPHEAVVAADRDNVVDALAQRLSALPAT